ncbi:ubiquinol cytochrome c reductase Rieske [Echinococcus multilocularis]|uniref:Ubiquinol cytochrome c reductase Rieske n=1 Tax=Echinococcus multilocularis TaxID=6211 RepID=A0A068Y3Z5_ECHMU|nr:ubiquinol cytochrome c reductase Rieske [Echinococcus multilocularis]
MASGLVSPSRVVASVRSIPLSLSTTCPKCLSNKVRQPLPTLPRPLSSRVYGPLFSVISRSVVSCGIGMPQQVRFSHVDVTSVPSFDAHRLNSTRDPKSLSSKTEVNRKVFTYTIAFAGTVLATTSAKYAVKTLIQTIGPSASTLALANLEVSLASIPEGKNVVFKWRNKPLFVRHRTQSMIDQERSVPLSALRDPETDEQRVKDPKWLVCVGVCTHLGCVPIADAGEFGGYYCPCHGSHFDFSGRIRKGPAPTNMEVPSYKCPSRPLLKFPQGPATSHHYFVFFSSELEC